MRKMYRQRLGAVLGIFIFSSFLGCSDDSIPVSLRVRVVNADGKEIPGATVVLGNPDGGMVTYGTTDTTGVTRFQNPPPRATVTAAMDCQTTSYHYYSLAAVYDVNISEVTLILYDCAESSNYGTINVDVTDGVSGIEFREVTAGGITYGGTAYSFSLPVYPFFFQNDGKISVIAVGYDANDTPVGYGLLLDQTFYDGITVDVTIDQTDLGEITYTMENAPTSATGYLLMNPVTRKNSNIYIFNIWGEAPVPPSAIIPYIEGVGESCSFIANVFIDRDEDGTDDSEIGIQKKSPAHSNQVFDFNETPLIPFNLSFSTTKPDCPTISWSGSDVSSQFIEISFSTRITSPSKEYFSYSFTLSPSRTKIIFPELPENLAPFRPSGYQYLDLSVNKYDFYLGYDDYLRKTDMHYRGLFEEPAEFIYAYSQTGL